VNCQHFHQLLEMLEDDECAFFNEVMYTFDMNEEQEDDRMLGGYGTSSTDEAAAHLSKALQKVEDKIPTYRVERSGKKKKRSSGGWHDDDDDIGLSNQTSSPERGRAKNNSAHSFPFNILQPLCVDTKSVSTQPRQSGGADGASGGSNESAEGVHKMSVEFLLELEKGSWSYEKQFEIPIGIEEDGEEGEALSLVEIREKVRLREAIGERRYRAWKLAQEQKFVSDDPEARLSSEDMISAEANPALDLTSLLSSMADETSDASSVPRSALSIPSQNSSRPSTLSPEQQRVADAKDRDVLRRCLERAYGSRRTGQSEVSSPVHSNSDSFFENGRDLIAEAEAALRNPSAQRFLVSVLSQRSRLESQKKRRSIIEDPKGARRQSAQTSVSRLETSSFECLVRLCCAMLDSCMESKEYESAYGLLTHTAGFCTLQTKEGRGVETQREDAAQDPGNKVIYMTARIGLHSIFADLRLWEEVLKLHLKDRENDKTPGAPGASLIGKANTSDLVEYEAAVATLYEMLGFGIPAEELARFATQVSEERKWFETERGHSLVMLARRLGVRKEQGDEGAGTAGDLDLMGNAMHFQGVPGVDGEPGSSNMKGEGTAEERRTVEWTEIGWCHPAAPSTVRPQYVQSGASADKNISGSRHLKRSAVTSVASFGSSIVASGGLDGSVFVAHTIQFERDEDGKRSEICVQGVHLDWGSSGSRTAAVASSVTSMDGEYGVGAVSCLAAAKGTGYRSSALSASGNKDVKGKSDQEEFLSAMEGCRVVAGTTAGDLRVWSVKDVYAATVLAKKGFGKDGANDSRDVHRGSGATSSFIGKAARRGSITDIAAGSASSRLNFSLRGRALSGHRGGVSCLDVPSHIYRPDALVTGGADGFIKLWSLRQPIAGRRDVLSGPKATMFGTSMGASPAVDPMGQGRTTRSGDALSILSGHTGRVLCVKTAWHGDRLLSGGADRTVRIWDLAGSGGKCLHTLTGHLGLVNGFFCSDSLMFRF
jgi:WD40 repeat protein